MSDRSEGPSMEPESARDTRASILSGMRLSKDNNRRKESQARFFDKYGPIFLDFFTRKRLKLHDAEDLASDLVAMLLKTMENFQYDPTQHFRGYLHSVGHRALTAFWRKQAKERKVAGVDLQQLPAREELEQRLKDQFDLDLLAEAKRVVQGQVSQRDWDIWVELTERPTKPEQLAKNLGITRHNVDVAKARVFSRINSEVRKLQQKGFEEE